MKIQPMNITDPTVLELFSEHDDFMIEFLGKDSHYYIRYTEQENIENVWVAYVDDFPAGCIAYRSKTDGVGEVKRLFLRKEYRGRDYTFSWKRSYSVRSYLFTFGGYTCNNFFTAQP